MNNSIHSWASRTLTETRKPVQCAPKPLAPPPPPPSSTSSCPTRAANISRRNNIIIRNRIEQDLSREPYRLNSSSSSSKAKHTSSRLTSRSGSSSHRSWPRTTTTTTRHKIGSINSQQCRQTATAAAAGNIVAAVLLLVCVALMQLTSHTAAAATSDESSEQADYYQPVLIGFRSEMSSSDFTAGGVSVIGANTPVTLTLYGDSFTTRTIVAFTNEFRPDSRFVDLSHSPLLHGDLKPTGPATPAKSNQTAAAATNSTGVVLRDQPQPQAQAPAAAAAAERRRFQRGSYDCTDYNRVTSYKLTEANILTPNVVKLTVTLPELDPGAGMYYYFCIKQPKQAPSEKQQTAATDGSSPNNSSSSSSSKWADEQLVWVHQGVQWWVTLRVEPPILSVANDITLIVFLLFLSAVTSGLNLGLMSLDMNELAVISSCGDPKERSYARTIAPLRKRGNYLLCSLLLGNVMVNSTLTVILEELTSGLVAIIGSTLAIVVLGEIVPQAFCARQGLAIGARTIYLTYAFMLLTFPLSYPISCLLDYVLGEEKGNVYDRERLMEFIKITGHHTQLEADEVAIISGALKLKKIKVEQIMTRIEDVFMLPIDCKLDRDTIKRIIEKGYSRIPIYEFGDRKQIVALILAKDLALIDPDDHTPIANMLMYCKHPLIFIDESTPLDVALNEFKTGKSHMAVVRQIYDDGEIDKYYEAVGVVTLEDVIEEVLQVEINDETDTLSDNRRKRRRTDAQVHLIDELTQPPALPLPIEQPAPMQQPSLQQPSLQQQQQPLQLQQAQAKDLTASLSQRLTDVSIPKQK